MSGTPPSPHRDQDVHIRAAREWLARADEQFAAGESVMAAATLMLAQAELRLLVERVASAVPAPLEARAPTPFKFLPLGRTLIGATALAACLILGVFIGRAWTPEVAVPGPTQLAGQAPSGELPVEPMQLPAVQPAEPATPVEEVSAASQEETLLAEAPTAPSPAPSPPHRAVRRPPQQATPSGSETPATVGESKPEEATASHPEEPGTAETAGEERIPAAEVALRTIRALSERLLRGDAK